MSELMSLGPLDGRYAPVVAELAPVFSEFGLIRRRLHVEVLWLKALCAEPGIPEARLLTDAEQATLDALVEGFRLADAEEVKRIEKTTNHDVKAVEYFLRGRLRGTSMEDLSGFLHFACTSEDINNLAHALMLKDGLRILRTAAESVEAKLRELAGALADAAMMAHTHGQPASPTTMGKELGVFAARLRRQSDALSRCSILGKMNGAVGNFNAHLAAYPSVDWIALTGRLLRDELGLEQNLFTTQIESHDAMAEVFDAMARWNRVLLDIDRDVWTYISMGYFTQKTVAGEVGSSTMPHKVNPIDFENSEGNLGLANALLEHLSSKLPVSRMQRDLTDSTVLRNMGVAFGHSLLAIKSTLKGLNKLRANRAKMLSELDGAWEVLAEPIQTAMRKAGMPDAYEKLKELTRGKAMTAEAIRAFVAGLDLPAEDRRRLLELTPAGYTGMAADLARLAAG
jgi:adenylosuccinate lyase